MSTHQASALISEVPARPFRDGVKDAVATLTGDDLVEQLLKLHEADRLAAAEHLATVQEMNSRLAADCATQSRLCQGALEAERHAIRRATEHFAVADGAVAQLRQLRARCEKEEGLIAASEVMSVLTSAPARVPWRPHILAFVASLQYRLGDFRSENGSFHRLFPFVGWSMYEESLEGPPVYHATFLVDGLVKATPDLYRDQGLVLRHLE